MARSDGSSRMRGSREKTLTAAELDRPDVQARRAAWRQEELDPRRLVFIDETWAKTNMRPMVAVAAAASAW
jgi:hypothetical protein